MLEKLTFKIFGFTEQEVRKTLSEGGLTPLSVEETCRDAKLVLTAEDASKEEMAFRVYSLFTGCVYRECDGTLAETVLERLRLYNQTLSVAESCTGGLIASDLVEVPGCSDCFMEGIVSYSNRAKTVRLGVNPTTINMFGAVSREVACQMATGLMREGVNFAVSTTGIAGPGGGSEEKPVGLVYIAVADEINCSATECRFEGSRNEIRRLAANTALFLLWKRLVKPIDFDSMVIE